MRLLIIHGANIHEIDDGMRHGNDRPGPAGDDVTGGDVVKVINTLKISGGA